MGIKPGDGSYIPGVDCGQCNAALFAGVTPKYIEANFADVVTCPAMPNFVNGAYLLTQTGVACTWTYVDGLWLIQLDFLGLNSNLAIVNFVFTYFSDPSFVNCRDTFTNQQPGVCGVGQGGHSGTAELFWGPGIGP